MVSLAGFPQILRSKRGDHAGKSTYPPTPAPGHGSPDYCPPPRRAERACPESQQPLQGLDSSRGSSPWSIHSLKREGAVHTQDGWRRSSHERASLEAAGSSPPGWSSCSSPTAMPSMPLSVTHACILLVVHI